MGKQDASAPNGDNLRLARDERALCLKSTKGLNVRTGHGGSIKELGELNQFMEHHLDEKQDDVRLRYIDLRYSKSNAKIGNVYRSERTALAGTADGQT